MTIGIAIDEFKYIHNPPALWLGGAYQKECSC